jgi:hypothetical protein
MAKFKSEDYCFILGQSVPKREVYFGLAIILIVVFGMLAIAYYAYWPRSREVVAVTEEPEVLVIEAEQLEGETKRISLLEDLLGNHVSRMRLKDMNSYMANGYIYPESGTVEKLTTLTRRPNFYKQEIEYKNVILQIGYYNNNGWADQSRGVLNAEVAEFNSGLILMECSLAHLAWSYQSPEALQHGLETVLELLPSEPWQGRTCAVVLSHSILPFPVYHYIDTETYEEVYRRARIPKGSGFAEVEMHFDPTDETAPYGLPMGYQVFVDGELSFRVELERLRINQGLLTFLFQPPDGSLYTDLNIWP